MVVSQAALGLMLVAAGSPITENLYLQALFRRSDATAAAARRLGLLAGATTAGVPAEAMYAALAFMADETSTAAPSFAMLLWTAAQSWVIGGIIILAVKNCVTSEAAMQWIQEMALHSRAGAAGAVQGGGGAAGVGTGGAGQGEGEAVHAEQRQERGEGEVGGEDRNRNANKDENAMEAFNRWVQNVKQLPIDASISLALRQFTVHALKVREFEYQVIRPLCVQFIRRGVLRSTVFSMLLGAVVLHRPFASYKLLWDGFQICAYLFLSKWALLIVAHPVRYYLRTVYQHILNENYLVGRTLVNSSSNNNNNINNNVPVRSE